MAEKATKRVEMIGTEADLQRSSPLDMRQSAFPGGTLEMTGSEAGLSRSTTPMGVFDKGVRGGKVEMIGSECDLNRAPHRGFESYSTPTSENTKAPQESISGWPRSGRK